MAQTKTRLDIALVEQKFVSTRQKAQAHVMAGIVYVNDMKIDKPSALIKNEDVITLRGAKHPYVSRGALKLEKALKQFSVNASAKTALDIGASTGGFTDVLLQSGATHVYAIDVGYGQLDWKLRNDERVTVMERTNARYLKKEDFSKKISLAVMDVSFISITKILPAIMNIINLDGDIICLIKPQFEAGRENVGKKGVVRNPKVHEEVILNILFFLKETNWYAAGLSFSPITGPEGNIEFLLHLCSGKVNDEISESLVQEIVHAAHKNFKIETKEDEKA